MASAKQFVLEICVESIELAREAQRGGADRIELCRQLSLEGLTPSFELMQRAREQVSLPLHVLIRPRAGNFCYSDVEFEQMEEEIVAAKRLAMDGIVLGILNSDHTIDVNRTRQLVALAYPLRVTFHRAFDHTPNLMQALEDVVCAGANRILTSGGKDQAISGLSMLSQLIERASNRVIIMAGGGINEQNVAQIGRISSLREFHCSLGQGSANSGTGQPRFFEERVRNLYRSIATANHSSLLVKS
ncbi:MAG: copper homeostasis protein CutC [Acidobacteria bacterium]|nr:copper homeostasis protein CutC [Acidobacteriota bacterium]